MSKIKKNDRIRDYYRNNPRGHGRFIDGRLHEIPRQLLRFIYSNAANTCGITSSIFTNTNPLVIYTPGTPATLHYRNACSPSARSTRGKPA